MRSHWTLVALITAMMAAGCGDPTVENGQNPAETGMSPVVAPAEGVTNTPGIGSSTEVGMASAPQRPAGSGTRTPVAPSRPLAAVAPRTPAAPAPAPVPPRPQYRDFVVPAGTALSLELMTPLSSETAQLETPVRARLSAPVDVGGSTVIPAGAVLSGNVTEVEKAGRVRGRSRLAFRLTEVELSDGPRDLSTAPLSFEGEASRGEDAAKIGAGAIGGAIVGGILGGGDGAAKGAAVGGAAGTGVVLATRGKPVELTSGTSLTASLAEPLTVRVW